MKFLYIAPRYHTNQMDIMKGLIEHGHEVCFISHYAAAIEDYSYVTPVVLGYSKLYEIVDFLYVKVIHRKDPEAVVFKIRHGFPPVRKLKKLIYGFAPDVVILRERSVYSMAAYLLCRKKGYPCILYNQNPLWSEPEKRDPAHRIVGRLSPALRMTPVMGMQKAGTSIKASDFFVPFVVEPRRGPAERSYFAADTVHILCIGKYEIRKHHLLLLQVVEELLALCAEALNAHAAHTKINKIFFKNPLQDHMDHNVYLTSEVLVRLESESTLSYLVFSLGNVFVIPLSIHGINSFW